MTRTDDMVLVPAFETEDDTPARQEARRGRFERRIPRSRLMRRLRRAATARKLRQARARRSAARAQTMARTGSRVAARGAARGAGRLVANPVGAIITAAVVATIVGVRLSTGRPLEGLGADINRAVLGDMDEKARARANVRESLSSNPELARIAALNGGPTEQMRQVFDGLVEVEEREVIGRTLLEERFPANNIVDLMILRAAELFRGKVKEGAAGGTSAAPEREFSGR